MEATQERAARNLRRHLADDERLLASIVGREVREGWARRRVALAATDRRLLLVWMRPGTAPASVSYDEVERVETALGDRGQRVTVVATDDVTLAVQDLADDRRTELLLELVRERLTR